MTKGLYRLNISNKTAKSLAYVIFKDCDEMPTDSLKIKHNYLNAKDIILSTTPYTLTKVITSHDTEDTLVSYNLHRTRDIPSGWRNYYTCRYHKVSLCMQSLDKVLAICLNLNQPRKDLMELFNKPFNRSYELKTKGEAV